MSHRWKLFLVVAVVMLLLTGIWVATMHWTADSDVDAYRKSLIAKGEELEIAEVLPPPVPVEQNGAELVQEAFSLFVPASNDISNIPSAMRMVAPGKAIVCFKQPDVRGYDFTNSWSNIMDVVEAERPAIELLKQTMNYPALDFHVEYEKWPNTPLTHLAPFKRCVISLSSAAMCDLHEGDTGSATTNICAMLGLVNGWQDERFLISQLVRMAMVQIAVRPIWEYLQSTNVSDVELAMLQTNWEKLEFTHAMENAILMERASTESVIKRMRTSSQFFNEIVVGGPATSGSWGSSMDFWDSVKFTGAKFMWRASWTYSDELQMLQNYQLVLKTLRTTETNGFFNPAYSNMVNQLQANEPTNDPDSWIDKMDEKGLQRMFSEDAFGTGSLNRVMAMEAAREIIITAIALKRYQLKYGDYPTNLDSLVPQFVAAVPIDPVDGRRLRYRLNAGGTYLLYSIGQDGKDDGGDPSLGASVRNPNLDWLNRRALDWVWPQPATKAEIEYFYAHPPK
jgi:hypothetical protein